MNLHKKVILIFFYTIKLSSIFPKLLPDTLIFMGNRAYMRAKDLNESTDKRPTLKIENGNEKIKIRYGSK